VAVMEASSAASSIVAPPTAMAGIPEVVLDGKNPGLLVDEGDRDGPCPRDRRPGRGDPRLGGAGWASPGRARCSASNNVAITSKQLMT